ncbi:MAG: riboflavin synthase, partial [Dehalococcoidia bacterium]|nr:riboflavin synthase [Dehalococcoidia bacterium]
MFSGIVEEVGVVKARGAESLTISANRVLEEAALGDSIAVNGVCLTVTAMDKGSFSADVMTETLRCTNLGLLRIGGRVN